MVTQSGCKSGSSAVSDRSDGVALQGADRLSLTFDFKTSARLWPALNISSLIQSYLYSYTPLTSIQNNQGSKSEKEFLFVGHIILNVFPSQLID